MPDIELTRSHSLGLDGGREAVERVAQQLKSDLEVDYRWDDDTLRFDGSGADGTIEVEADAVRIAISLSAFLRPLQGRIEEEAGRYLDQHLDGA
ncbi:MAG: polyhydroxyalkanoic acid system family protein [Salinibacter sp.]